MDKLEEVCKKYPAIERAKRIYDWSQGKPSDLFKLVITPTDRCNLNCIFCPNYTARNKGRFKAEDELKKEEWIRVVEEGLRIGVKQLLILGGGEPMMRSDTVLDILRRVKGLDCELFTNGTLFRPEELKELIRVELQRIIVSVHGLGETYNFLTGSKTFERLKENLLLLKRFKEEMGSKKPRVLINVVINKKNFKEVLKIIEFVGRCGCDELAFHPMRGYEETESVIEKLELSEREMEELRGKYRDAKAMAEKYGINFTTQPIELDSRALKNDENEPSDLNVKGPRKFLRLRCLEPWYSMVINPDGRVGRCTAYITRREPLNVLEQSLKEVWESDFFNKVRDNILNGRMMEGCRRCGLLTTTAELKEHLRYFILYKENKLGFDQMVKGIRGW